MNWQDSYQIGVEEIDTQHKNLLKKIEEFKEKLSDENSYREILPALKFLVNYTHYHFDSEEHLMIEIDYPEFEQHQHKHRQLTNELKMILLKVSQHKPFTPIELYYFMSKWLTTHILEEDMKIRDYIKKNKIKLNQQEVEYAESGYILDQCTLKIENIIKQNLAKGISSTAVLNLIEKAITDFFAANKLTKEKELRTIFKLIHEDLLMKRLIDTEMELFIRKKIIATINLQNFINNSFNKVQLLRFLLEQNILTISDYEKLKQKYAI